jgi:hypothetical protein
MHRVDGNSVDGASCTEACIQRFHSITDVRERREKGLGEQQLNSFKGKKQTRRGRVERGTARKE